MHVLVTTVDERRLEFPFRPPVAPFVQVAVYDALGGDLLLVSVAAKQDVRRNSFAGDTGRVFMTWLSPRARSLGVVQMATISLLDVFVRLTTSNINPAIEAAAIEIGWQQDVPGDEDQPVWFISRDTLNRAWQAPVSWTRSVMGLV